MSNQYGLTIDNMAAFELVLPNGTITTVTESSEDLWFALRVSDLTPQGLASLRLRILRAEGITLWVTS
jgi:FAD/FMN-containing dehydrogenase